MSRKVAEALAALVQGASALQPRRQRAKTIPGVIEALQRRSVATVETPHGPLKLLAHRSRHVASAAGKFLDEEPETLEWVDQMVRPGEMLWDVGAAMGQVALYAALKGARVAAFEPKATSFALLVEHVVLNELGERVTPLCLALSDKRGLTALHVGGMEAGGAMNALAGSTDQFGAAPSGYAQPVLSVRMDELASEFGVPAPDHIKLDVDGAEGWIVAGGPESLKRARSVLVEVEGENAAHAGERLERPLEVAGLREDLSFRGRGSGRNRLYLRNPDTTAWRTPAG